MNKQEQFFYDHAGFSYDPATETPEQGRVRCAKELAAAEIVGLSNGWTVVTEVDPDPIWDDDVKRESTDYDQYVVVLLDIDSEVLETLGSVDLGPDGSPSTDPYVRVVGAELVDQAIAEAGEGADGMRRDEIKVGEEYLVTTSPNQKWLDGSDWRADRVRVLDTTGWKKVVTPYTYPDTKTYETESGETVRTLHRPGGTGILVRVLTGNGKPSGEVKTIESRYFKDTWANAEARIAARKASNQTAQQQETERKRALMARQQVVIGILKEHGIKARPSYSQGHDIVLELDQAEALVHAELRVKEF